jgi:hypothetical protein
LKSFDHFDEGGFTCSVRAKKSKEFPFADVEVYAINSPDILEVLAYLPDLDYGFLSQSIILLIQMNEKLFNITARRANQSAQDP